VILRALVSISRRLPNHSADLDKAVDKHALLSKFPEPAAPSQIGKINEMIVGINHQQKWCLKHTLRFVDGKNVNTAVIKLKP
jgi:hypothetical protein